MSRRLVLRIVVAMLAASAMIGGPIAAASASDLTIKIALVRVAPRLRHSQTRLRRALRHYKVTRRAARVIRAIRAQDRDLYALRTRIRRTSTSSSTGTVARRDIVRGLGLVLKSNREVGAELRRQGPYGLSPRQVRRATRLATRGNRLYRRGVLLLAHS